MIITHNKYKLQNLNYKNGVRKNERYYNLFN